MSFKSLKNSTYVSLHFNWNNKASELSDKFVFSHSLYDFFRPLILKIKLNFDFFLI